ncbi:MAG: hypothetical protein ACYCVH_12825 [Ignavibacteriaceae bacterium]
MENKTNLTIADNTKELIIRPPGWRAAEIIIPNEQVIINGSIFSPQEYLSKRSHLIQKDKAYLLFDKKNYSIIFFTDEGNPKQTIISGSLKENPELSKFFINEQKTFTLKELLKLLRFNSRFFVHSSEFDSLYHELTNFKYSQQIECEKKEDFRGNSANSFSKKTLVNIPYSFILTIPLFNDTPLKSFEVIIYFDITDDVKFWFESVDLIELREKFIDDLFLKQETIFKDYVRIYSD